MFQEMFFYNLGDGN